MVVSLEICLSASLRGSALYLINLFKTLSTR